MPKSEIRGFALTSSNAWLGQSARPRVAPILQWVRMGWEIEAQQNTGGDKSHTSDLDAMSAAWINVNAKAWSVTRASDDGIWSEAP